MRYKGALREADLKSVNVSPCWAGDLNDICIRSEYLKRSLTVIVKP